MRPARPLGIFSWFGYDLPLTESFRRIRAAGFDGVILWWGEYEGDVPLLRQPALARRMGLRVENAHAPFDDCNRLWLPGAEGDRWADRLIRLAGECAGCGVDTLVVHPVDGDAPPPLHPRGLERLRRCVEKAGEMGVTLAVENLRQPAYTSAVLDALPAAALCYDCGHARVETPPPSGCPAGDDLPGRYPGRVAAVHLHDNDGKGDQHRLPFDGVIDWEGVVRRLRAAEYRGPLTLEVQAGEYEARMDADAFLRRAFGAAARLRDRLDGADGSGAAVRG